KLGACRRPGPPTYVWYRATATAHVARAISRKSSSAVRDTMRTPPSGEGGRVGRAGGSRRVGRRVRGGGRAGGRRAGRGGRGSRSGRAGRRRRDLLAVVAEPAVAERAPQLADPARRHVERLAQVLGALALGHGPDHPPLAAGERPEPGREV